MSEDIPDDATLMAYADGELDPLASKHVERALAADPTLAAQVAAHRALGRRLAEAYAPVAAAPVPDRLAALLTTNVVPIDTARRSAIRRAWPVAVGLAASLVLGVGLGTRWTAGDGATIVADRGGLVAAGALARGLDTQLAATAGEPRILVSFRAASGYCRVFASAAADGIACRDGDRWRIDRTQAPASAPGSAYRQAGSTDAALMAAAQDMTLGAPLDAAAERRARDAGWR